MKIKLTSKMQPYDSLIVLIQSNLKTIKLELEATKEDDDHFCVLELVSDFTF